MSPRLPAATNPPDWFDELNMDPGGTAVAMGTRALGNRPWLVPDHHLLTELALKAELLSTRHSEVFHAEPDSTEAAQEVVRLVDAAGITMATAAGPEEPHPLEVAGRSVQEDLCLLRRRADGWYLEAASLCFPSRWRLGDKIGRHITEVHAPVAGYEQQLSSRVDSLFDRLGPTPVWRRNWFLHADNALFQPDRPAQEPLVAPDRVLSDLHLRSERQTLRQVLPSWILFTIRVQRSPLAAFVADAERRGRIQSWLAGTPESEASRHGITPTQRSHLLTGI